MTVSVRARDRAPVTDAAVTSDCTGRALSWQRDGQPSYSEANRLDRVTPFPLCPGVRPMGPVGQATRHSRPSVLVSILPSSYLCYKH